MTLPVTSDLTLHLAAADLPLTDGQAVTAWPDSSPAGNHASVLNGTAPIYCAGMTVTGGPAVRFAEASFEFTNKFAVFPGSTSAELFAVVRDTSSSADNTGFYQFGGNDRTYYPYVDGNIYDGSFTNSRYSYPAVTPRNWHLYHVYHDGTQRVTAIDGVVVHSVTIGFTQPVNSDFNVLRIGRTYLTWAGEIAVFVAYRRSLTGPERAATYDYLNSQYLTKPSPNIQAPPVQLGAGLRAALNTGVTAGPLRVSVKLPAPTLNAQTVNGGNLAAPAVTVGVQLHAASAGIVVTLAAPAITVGIKLAASLSDATITLSAPEDQAVLVSDRPAFVVALAAVNETLTYTVEIQYANNPAFTNATTLSAPAPVVDGGVIITAPTPVPATTYWRARLLLDGDEQISWTSPFTFTVDNTVTAVTLPVTWTVTPAAARPIHLWHLDPAGPHTGDTVTAYGQGFPATGTLTFGDTVLSTASWSRVPASTTAANPDRAIDGGTVDCEHYEIVFTAPAYNGPGDVLSVEG